MNNISPAAESEREKPGNALGLFFPNNALTMKFLRQ